MSKAIANRWCSVAVWWLLLSFTHCSEKMNTIEENADLLQNLMETRPEQFAQIIEKKDQYEVQIIYTQIDRDSANRPSFTSFYFNVDSARYFYPASTVKMPVALLALEKLNALGIEHLDMHTAMLTDSAYSGQSAALEDTTSESRMPSIAHYIKKIFLVSDNDAFNRLYEFVGQQRINERLKEMGYEQSRIVHRLNIFLSEEENRRTNPVRFMRNDSIIYAQPESRNASPLPVGEQVLKGKGYQSGDRIVQEPMEFTHKNFTPLGEMHDMLKAVIFPEAVPPDRRFNLGQADYEFVYRYMSQLPSETHFPQYDTAEFFDAYSKFLMYGNDKTNLPKHIRIFNKMGQAYGFLSDNAYIADFEKKVEFMLSAVILVNENGIFNDGQYEYDSTGFPFMKNLGRLIYDYELGRKRPHAPDLSRYMVGYDKPARVSAELHANLFQNYTHYHIPALNRRKTNRSDIAPLIEQLQAADGVEVTVAGKSVEGRDINLIKMGNGPTRVLLWSQMHGDESTATRALMEMFKFFTADDEYSSERALILDQLTLYFLPMLNPDGAEVFVRQNALGIDLNRDALRLVSPEAKILKEVRDAVEPHFGFNLHDQSRYYNVARTNRTAAISFLAPAYDYPKNVNNTRASAMKAIVAMNAIAQQYMPGHVGRYNDDFEPRAFGDNIQKWGTSTILLESGGYPGDPEKRMLVKMNFVLLLQVLHDIASGALEEYSTDAYTTIPENDRKLFDLLIRNATMRHEGKEYTLDVGVLSQEGPPQKGQIEDIGDLSTYYGYREYDAEGLVLESGRVYPVVIDDAAAIGTDQVVSWLKEGYTTILLANDTDTIAAVNIHTQSADEPSQPQFALGEPANFILKKGDEVKAAVVNGAMVQWHTDEQ
jgi:hypothetical protein